MCLQSKCLVKNQWCPRRRGLSHRLCTQPALRERESLPEWAAWPLPTLTSVDFHVILPLVFTPFQTVRNVTNQGHPFLGSILLHGSTAAPGEAARSPPLLALPEGKLCWAPLALALEPSGRLAEVLSSVPTGCGAVLDSSPLVTVFG